MSSKTQHIISTKAYQKIILHAVKHPFTTVNGVLLGKYSAGNSEEVTVTDAIPLFHHWTTLTPMLEVGLQQVDIYAAHHKIRIVGYYHANENINDKSLPAFGSKIVSKIRESFTDAIALIIQNTKLSLDSPEVAILVTLSILLFDFLNSSPAE
ncbi:6721_t:CDS:2 [Ambispora gerdemannii]|uniref:6721_t:CDS:1 n=1 Tax=Ambispora gerdemannii TaxID=144530 RepID=A0A9N8V3G0_9GLOM|nr:6721_t:CDS:2 [Ambispora gerdemannii]